MEWDWNRQSRGGGRGLRGLEQRSLAVVPDVDPDKFRFIEKARYRLVGFRACVAACTMPVDGVFSTRITREQRPTGRR